MARRRRARRSRHSTWNRRSGTAPLSASSAIAGRISTVGSPKIFERVLSSELGRNFDLADNRRVKIAELVGWYPVFAVRASTGFLHLVSGNEIAPHGEPG